MDMTEFSELETKLVELSQLIQELEYKIDSLKFNKDSNDAKLLGLKSQKEEKEIAF